MKNFCQSEFDFIFKILYALALCFTALALNRQLTFYQHSICTLAVSNQDAAESMRIALTFDDGPHPYYTQQLLDGLKQRDIKATFFVTGEHAEQNPDIIRRMYDEGHLIGNHTYSHIQLTDSNREKFRQELIQTNEILHDITGTEILYVRPPYGIWDKKFEGELNMFPVLWNIDPLDWCSSDTACIAQAVINNAKENAVILMHDYYKTSVDAALIIVDELKAQGYEFVTVDKLLFD